MLLVDGCAEVRIGGNEMTNGKTQATLENFFEHVKGVMQSCLNLRWDDVEFHLRSMATIAETAAASEKRYIDALHEPVKEFALGFRQMMTADTLADKEQALAHLTGARNALRKLRTEQRELTENPGFAQFALGIEEQILSVQEQIANIRGDANEVARLKQQQVHLLDEFREMYEPDHPMRHYFEAFKQFSEALPKFIRGMEAFQEMNLDLAQQYLEESSKAFSGMQDHLSKAAAAMDELLFKAVKSAAEGLRLLAGAQDIYVRTLRAAIIGDVTRSDVKALEKAERWFLDGVDLFSKGTAAMPGVFGGLDLEPAAQRSSQLTRNLRTLCERSLSPKEITLTTAPKVVFYFLGTFLVLLIGLPISGLVAELQSNDIALLLLVSLLVSVIGAFGFEATRFVPLFEVFTRVLPWAHRSREESEKEP